MIEQSDCYKIMSFYSKSIEELENVIARLDRLQDEIGCGSIPDALHAMGQIEAAISVLENAYRTYSVYAEGYDPKSIKEEEDEN